MESSTSPRTTIAVFVAVIVMIAAGAALVLGLRPPPVQITINPPVPTATPGPTATPAPITVYVTGAVARPQSLVTLPAGSRVQDALAAAGGAAAEADLNAVNLAGLLRDGDQVFVPALSAAGNPLPTTMGGPKVRINLATAEELDALPGIGASTAAAIVAYREQNGPFTALADLDNVEGIGPALLEDIADLIVFD